jgi:hypothetical protein
VRWGEAIDADDGRPPDRAEDVVVNHALTVCLRSVSGDANL